MVGRLGQVLYWAGCAIALVIILFGLVITFNMSDDNAWMVTVAAAVVGMGAWLIGRAALYVLAGR